jgi:hypothetical protein
MKQFAFIALCLTLMSSSCTKQQPEYPVQYYISVQNIWGVDSHPTDYPAYARLDPFLAVSHRETTNLFNLLFPATDGIRQMAESGVMVKLEQEVDEQRGGDLALDRSLGDRLTFFETSTVFLGFNDVNTYLTLIAHISPSPDWFISAYKVNLKPNGVWMDSVVIYPDAYDAGIDLSQTFTGDAIPANPAQPVSVITTVPLANNGVVAPLAKITLVRIK